MATIFTRVPGTTTTICAITLTNGFVVTGTSACVEIANFDADLGNELAYGKAVSKIWELEAYLLSEERFKMKQSFIADELEAQEAYLSAAGEQITQRVSEYLSAAGLSDIKVNLNISALEPVDAANGEKDTALAA